MRQGELGSFVQNLFLLHGVEVGMGEAPITDTGDGILAADLSVGGRSRGSSIVLIAWFVMGEQTLTLQQAWGVYERWLGDPRLEFYPEPRDLEAAFREATAPFALQRASKWVGDCYLLAYAKESDATLVTFDQALLGAARKHGYTAIVPG